MDQNHNIHAGKLFWQLCALLLSWICLPVGMRAVIRNELDWGNVLLIILGLLGLVVALSKRVLTKLEGKDIDKRRIFATIILFSGVGAVEIYALITREPINSGDAIFLGFYSIVLLILLALVFWRIAVAWRQTD